MLLLLLLLLHVTRWRLRGRSLVGHRLGLVENRGQPPRQSIVVLALSITLQKRLRLDRLHQGQKVWVILLPQGLVQVGKHGFPVLLGGHFPLVGE